jgi:hypothetical protein
MLAAVDLRQIDPRATAELPAVGVGGLSVLGLSRTIKVLLIRSNRIA